MSIQSPFFSCNLSYKKSIIRFTVADTVKLNRIVQAVLDLIQTVAITCNEKVTNIIQKCRPTFYYCITLVCNLFKDHEIRGIKFHFSK